MFGDAEVTRSELEQAIGGELDRAIDAVHDTLHRGGVHADDVGSVLLTGGSSLIPALQDRLRSVFAHLADDLSFDAGTPGDVESERRALTASPAVSRCGGTANRSNRPRPAISPSWFLTRLRHVPSVSNAAHPTFSSSTNHRPCESRSVPGGARSCSTPTSSGRPTAGRSPTSTSRMARSRSGCPHTATDSHPRSSFVAREDGCSGDSTSRA